MTRQQKISALVEVSVQMVRPLNMQLQFDMVHTIIIVIIIANINGWLTKCFAYINSFNLHNILPSGHSLLYSFYRWETRAEGGDKK